MLGHEQCYAVTEQLLGHTLGHTHSALWPINARHTIQLTLLVRVQVDSSNANASGTRIDTGTQD